MSRDFAAPTSVRQALENVAVLLGEREGDRTDYGMLMVACYGPLFRWNPVKGRHCFQARRAFPPGVRDSLAAVAEALTDEVVRVLGGERGATLRDVRAALDNLTD